MLIVPLTSIKHQLLDDCVKMGITVLDGDQVVKLLTALGILVMFFLSH